MNRITSLTIKLKIAQHVAFLKEVITLVNQSFGRHNNMSYAAAIAYHGMISLPSLLLLIILALGRLLDSGVVTEVIITTLTRLFSRENPLELVKLFLIFH